MRPSQSRPGEHTWVHSARKLALDEPPTCRTSDGKRWHVQVNLIEQLIEHLYFTEGGIQQPAKIHQAFEDCMCLRRGMVQEGATMRKLMKAAMVQAGSALQALWGGWCEELRAWLQEAEEESGRSIEAAVDRLGWPEDRVRAVACMLEKDGTIYSTIDDNHFAVLTPLPHA